VRGAVTAVQSVFFMERFLFFLREYNFTYTPPLPPSLSLYEKQNLLALLGEGVLSGLPCYVFFYTILPELLSKKLFRHKFQVPMKE